MLRGATIGVSTSGCRRPQAGPALYANNDLDRGHLVRRRDPVWGAPAFAARVNDDTFLYTVCTPQTATLNQSKMLWLGLKDYVLDHARQYSEKLSVFSGCVFSDTDPVYRDIAIPRRFFKIAVWVRDSVLAATGYVLDQSPSLDPILQRPIRADTCPPQLGPYRTFQVPIGIHRLSRLFRTDRRGENSRTSPTWCCND